MDQILDPSEPRTRTAVTTPTVPTVDLSRAPLPTDATLRRRRSLPVQAVRFVVFNGRIMRMVLKGHH